VEWARETFPELTVREMGAGIHFVQEDQPAAIGQAIAEWLRSR
jgi:haloalkane dehalogenase